MKAFPSKKFDRRESKVLGGTCFTDHESGMDLRDYFAAKAISIQNNSHRPEFIAKNSYDIADAMMKQREL